MRTFPLFAFSDSNLTVITRGENEEQAMTYATRVGGVFPRGVVVYPLDHLPVEAAKLYEINHSSGWLYRAPKWLQQRYRDNDARKDPQSIIGDILNFLSEKKSI